MKDMSLKFCSVSADGFLTQKKTNKQTNKQTNKPINDTLLKVFQYSFFGDHTLLFQLAFKKSSLSRIDVKFTQVIGFGLKFVLI